MEFVIIGLGIIIGYFLYKSYKKKTIRPKKLKFKQKVRHYEVYEDKDGEEWVFNEKTRKWSKGFPVKAL